MAESTNKPVVDPVKMPKLKTNAKCLASFNTWAIAIAAFLGFFGIFLAISLLTKGDWNFSPSISTLLDYGDQSVAAGKGYSYIAIGSIITVLFISLTSLLLGIAGIVTIGKITDADALKKAWKNVSRLLFTFVGIYAVHLFVLILSSLILIGKSEGTKIQKGIWLDKFLPSVIMALAAGGLAFLAKTIAGGKTANARIASFIGIGISGVGFILTFIAVMVTIYG